MEHDPPSGYYLGLLADALTARGVPARVEGLGAASYLAFKEERVAMNFGQIFLREPAESGRWRFAWSSGQAISEVNDIPGTIDKILEAIAPADEGDPQEGSEATADEPER
jgi:hypothetical protein